jgi:hypothetical protein
VTGPPVIDRVPSAACLLVEADLDKAKERLANARASWVKAKLARKHTRRKLRKAGKSLRSPKVRMAKRRAFRQAKRKARRARARVHRTNQAILVAEDVVTRVCG